MSLMRKLYPLLPLLVVGVLFPRFANAQAAAVVPSLVKVAPAVMLPPPGILMAGNGQSGIWLVVPQRVSKTINHPVFSILEHPINRQKGGKEVWREINRELITGRPHALAVLARRVAGQQVSSAYVFFGDGAVWAYGRDLKQSEADLPKGLQTVAAAGSSRGLCALAFGQLTVSINRAMFHPLQAQALGMSQSVGSVHNGSKPLAHKVKAGAEAPHVSHSVVKVLSRPTTELKRWFVYAFDGVRWDRLMVPGLVIPTAMSRAPGSVVLAWQAQRIWVIWINPADPHEINAQSLLMSGTPGSWSKVVRWRQTTTLSCIWPVSVDGRLLLLWPTVMTDGNVQIHAAQIPASQADWQSLRNFWKPVVVTSGRSIPIALTDVAAAADGDSIAVVWRNSADSLREITLDRRGRILGAPFKIIPRPSPPRNPENIQTLMMVTLVVLLALSLWQRQQIPDTGKLPGGMSVARLYQRIPAAAIDLGIPMVLVAVIFGADSGPLFIKMLKDWSAVFSSPDLFAREASLWWMLGLYIAHVTVGESIFGRSIGKLIFKLKVVSVDGGRPGLVSILIRNLMRLPELVSVVLLIFMVVSTDRQRLGDLMARTLVVNIA